MPSVPECRSLFLGIYADIRGGSSGRTRQTTVGLSKSVIFNVRYLIYVFGNFRGYLVYVYVILEKSQRGRIRGLPKILKYSLLSQERVKLWTSNLAVTLRGSKTH